MLYKGDLIYRCNYTQKKQDIFDEVSCFTFYHR